MSADSSSRFAILPIWENLNTILIDLVDHVPDDRMHWSPKPALWTFHHILQHLAEGREQWMNRAIHDGETDIDIYQDSNAFSLAAMVREIGGVPMHLGISSDTAEMLEAKLNEGLGADLLVTSAGVSRGDYDIVKDVLMKHGEIDFWTVRMRPGSRLRSERFLQGTAACLTSSCRETR